MTLNVVTAHAGAACKDTCISSWGVPMPLVVSGEQGMLQAYQYGLEQTDSDIIAFLHDDVRIDDADWRERVMAEFADESVGLVGFGGALQHGTDTLYKTPYDYRQLGRAGYLSNVDDAEVHGQRFTCVCDVAVLDGFALIIRREVLVKAGGWPLGTPIGYSLYDYWLCCETHRQGKRIRCVGVRSHHLGGQTAVLLKKAAGEGDAHERAHKWLYNHYRDVLPWRCDVLRSGA